ncbi:MAG: hypothetical protein Q8880_05150, partial [Bacteroidota bacterium]|nr:hypothetical protein [Bacteroidota bacterium]
MRNFYKLTFVALISIACINVCSSQNFKSGKFYKNYLCQSKKEINLKNKMLNSNEGKINGYISDTLSYFLWENNDWVLNGYGKKEYNHYGQILAKGYLPNKLLFTRAFDEYDKNGNIISEYSESLDTIKNKWLKNYTLSYKYDSLNNMFYQDAYIKSGDSLTLYYKVQVINKYDNNGHIIEYIGQSYDPQNNEWVNRAKVTMKYKGD